jgi:hypothetical protein
LSPISWARAAISAGSGGGVARTFSFGTMFGGGCHASLRAAGAEGAPSIFGSGWEQPLATANMTMPRLRFDPKSLPVGKRTYDKDKGLVRK